MRRRRAEVEKHTSDFLQACINEKRAEDKKHATATAQDAKEPDKEMQNESGDSVDIFALGKTNAGSHDIEAGRIDSRPCKVPGCRCMLPKRSELTPDEEEFLREIDCAWIKMIHGHDADA